MKKLDMVKGAVELVIAVGAGILTGNAINLVKPSNLGIVKKIAVGVGGWAISDMVVTKVTDHFDSEWDKVGQQLRLLFGKNKRRKKSQNPLKKRKIRNKQRET